MIFSLGLIYSTWIAILLATYFDPNAGSVALFFQETVSIHRLSYCDALMVIKIFRQYRLL
jgi:hypothetical protein